MNTYYLNPNALWRFGLRVSMWKFIPTRCPWDSSTSALLSSESISSVFSPIRGTPNSPYLALSPTSPLIDQGFGSSTSVTHKSMKSLRQQNFNIFLCFSMKIVTANGINIKLNKIKKCFDLS